MGVISFSDRPEEIWHVAGWAFRQVLDDIASQYPTDTELINQFERSNAIDGLIIELLEPSLAQRVVTGIIDVANGILDGSIRSGILDQPYGDEITVNQYLGALQDLLNTIPDRFASLGATRPE